MLKVLEYLNKRDRDIVEQIFGLNNKEKLTKKQVVQKFALEEEDLIRIFDRIESIKENELEFYDYFEEVDEETKKMIDRMSDTFFSMFKGIDPVVVEDCLRILPAKERDILFLFYGLDGAHCKDYDEIANEYGISVDEVDEILEKNVIRLKKYFKKADNCKFQEMLKKYSKYNEYEELVNLYGEEKVEKMLSMFTKFDQQIIKEYYNDVDSNFSGISRKYGVTYTYAYTHIKEGIKELKRALSNPSQCDVKTFSLSNKYKKVVEKFGQKKVESEIARLKEIDREIAKDYYGIGRECLSSEEIKTKYNVSSAKVNGIVSNLKSRLSKKSSLSKR